MIYLEFDDGHNDPIVCSYEDREDAIRRILGERPVKPRSHRDDGKFFRFGQEVTAEEALLLEQTDWDLELRDLEKVLCPEDDPRYDFDAVVEGYIYRRISAEYLESRSAHDLELAAKMRRGGKL